MKSSIHYGYARFEFDWTWIKTKQIVLSRGSNEQLGMLIILDEEGLPVRMYGYELISK